MKMQINFTAPGADTASVFSQERACNHRIGTDGEVCCEHPVTFCFARPVCDAASSVLQWLEFGLMQDARILWVEISEN